MPIDPKIKKLTGLRLVLYRINLYKTHVKGGVPSVFLNVGGEKVTPAHKDNRHKNFLKFVEMYFFQGPGSVTDWGHVGFIELTPSSMGYAAFKDYSQTDYGSAVIKEMVVNAKKYKSTNGKGWSGNGLVISMGREKTAKGEQLRIFLPLKFPSRKRFPVGGQKIFNLAIIHHELTHTILIRNRHSKPITIYDELWTVRNAENPVRMRRGKKLYEPRYVYYDGKKTINIITGHSEPGKWTVNKYDPRILVKLSDKDAL